MELKKVEKIGDIKQGDTIILTGGKYNKTPVKAQVVKSYESGGVEVIVDKINNHFFNVVMYLNGISWVRDVAAVV